eukprot:754952-Hanusia_phi.AAC.5
MGEKREAREGGREGGRGVREGRRKESGNEPCVERGMTMKKGGLCVVQLIGQGGEKKGDLSGCNEVLLCAFFVRPSVLVRMGGMILCKRGWAEMARAATVVTVAGGGGGGGGWGRHGNTEYGVLLKMTPLL